MNTTKTKYLRGRGTKDTNLKSTPLAVDGDELEKVDEFKYLGSLLTANNDTIKEIQTRNRRKNTFEAFPSVRHTIVNQVQIKFNKTPKSK